MEVRVIPQGNGTYRFEAWQGDDLHACLFLDTKKQGFFRYPTGCKDTVEGRAFLLSFVERIKNNLK